MILWKSGAWIGKGNEERSNWRKVENLVSRFERAVE